MEQKEITMADYTVDKLAKENASLKVQIAKLEFMVLQLQEENKALKESQSTEDEEEK